MFIVLIANSSATLAFVINNLSVGITISSRISTALSRNVNMSVGVGTSICNTSARGMILIMMSIKIQVCV